MAVNLGPSGLTLGSTTINDWDDVGGGKVLQVVSAHRNASYSMTSSYVTIDDATITLSSASNTVIVMVTIPRVNVNGTTSYDGPGGYVRILDNGGSNAFGTEFIGFQRDNVSSTKYLDFPVGIAFEHSPASTGNYTYTVQARYGDSATSGSVADCRITLMEIAG